MPKSLRASIFRLSLPFVAFCILAVASAIRSLSLERERLTAKKINLNDHSEITVLTNVVFYALEKEMKRADFVASALEIYDDIFNFEKPRGHLYSLDKDESLDFIANGGSLNNLTQELNLKGDVQLYSQGRKHQSEFLYYSKQNQFLEAKGNVHSEVIDHKTEDIIHVSANYLTSWPKEERHSYIGNVSGNIQRKLRYEAGPKFSSQKLTIYGEKSQINLSGNVHISRHNYILESQRAEIFLENFNKKLKYLVLYDDIKLEEKIKLRNGKQLTRLAYAEQLESIISQGKTILSGAPRVEQGDDVIRGYQITLRENVEIVEVDDAQSSFKVERNKE